MKKYFAIYKTFLKLNFTYWLTYRANFYNSLLSSLVWGFFNISVIYLLTAKTATVAGWTRYELLLLATAYTMFISMFHMFFSKNFEEFHTIIDQGKLDYLLLKPVNTQFLMTTHDIKYAMILRFILGGAFMYYLLYICMQYSPSLLQYVGFFLLLILGLIIVYSIWFIVSTIIIWNPRLSNVIELLYNTTSLARYPQDIFRELTFLLFFFVFPLTLVVNTPVKLLVGRDFIEDFVWVILLSLGLFQISSKFWKYALRHYTSASS